MSFLVGFLRAVLTEDGPKQSQIDGQSCRNELLKKRANAPKVWSDVYKRGTQAKKVQAEGQSCGRSMVEMLGVLAIIGVLSVGAIAGYQKAMEKHKLNKQLQQFSQLVGVGNRYYREIERSVSRSMDESVNYIFVNELFIKLGEVPTEMIATNKGNNSVYDSLKSGISFYAYKKELRLFVFVYAANKGDQASLAYCRNLFTVAQANQDEIAQLYLVSGWQESIDDRQESNIYGTKKCSNPSSKNCLKNMTLTDIDAICRAHNRNELYEFEFIWKY